MKLRHPWRNGGDDSALPEIEHYWAQVVIRSDADTDADGSPRVGSIDPKTGQSCTSLGKANGWRGAGLYPDSEKIPFFVLPMNFEKATGIAVKLGDVARLSFGDASVYAIFADQGPNELIGEASVCAIESLGGNPWSSDGTKIVRGIPHGVTYHILCGTADLKTCVDFDSIQAYGSKLFGMAAQPKQWPEASFPPLKRGARVLIDPGHSDRHPGASGKNSTVKEYALNVYQAEILCRELAQHGILGVIHDPQEDDLFDIGAKAQGHDAFVSLHLNAYASKDFYTCAMCHPRYQAPDSLSARIASEWAQAVADAVGNKCFSGTQGWPLGVMATGLAVLNAASKTDCPIAFLSEAFFVDAMDDVSVCKARIEKAMKAGAKVLSKHLLGQ